MAGINKVVLVGRVGMEPETKRFNSGDEIAEFSLATSDTWRDRSTGERREKTQWHRIKVTAEPVIKIVRDYVNKGDLIGIEGKVEYRQWEKDGEKRTATEIVVGPFEGKLHLLGSKSDNSGGGGRRDDRRDDQREDRGGRTTAPDLDDEIPF